MGYYSEICIKFTCHKEVSALHALDVLNNELKGSFLDIDNNYISIIFSKIIIEGIYITLYEKWAKWYYDYPEIQAIYSFIRCHTKSSSWIYDDTSGKEELFAGCHLVRIGQEFDDVENNIYGSPKEYINVINSSINMEFADKDV